MANIIKYGMHFFRLRVVNTLLFFLIGILVGFILKERARPPRQAAPVQRYQPDYDREASALAESPAPAEEETQQEPPETPRTPSAAKDRGFTMEMEDAEEAALEPDTDEAAAPEQRPVPAAVTPQDFFAKPAAYSGRELNLVLQIITAKRTQRGWRLNFVHAGADKSINYLNLDDDSVLGANPDLRTGYFYRVVFRCGSGGAAEGNSLSAITPTGEKAEWATGLSAVE